MSALKASKGPWVYKWFGGPQIGGGKDGSTAICTLWGSWRAGKPSPQDRANCNLICAAPELYTALNEVFDFLGGIDGAADVRGVALAAILKARGDA